MTYKIFSGSSHQLLAQEIAEILGHKLSEIEIKDFSCGEIYVKYKESFRGQDVFLVQTCRREHANRDLMELFLMVHVAKQSFARKVHVILPFFAYGRQDKIHEPREGISAKLMADLLVQSGIDHLITLHLHSDQTQGFFDVPVDNLNPRRVFVDYFKNKKIKNPVVVSPDVGGAKMAHKFSQDLCVPMAILHKQRPKHNCAEIGHVIGEVEGMTPILVDDMVDTAGSVCAAKEALIAAGSNDEVYLCTTHPVFSGKAQEKLDNAGFKEIVCTNSLPLDATAKNIKTLSMAPLFSDVIKNVMSGKSVSQLYL